MSVPSSTISRDTSMSEAEWETRCELAALYRLLHYYKMTDMIYTHLSARVPGVPEHFLINRYGEMFDEVTASSLVKMDMQGNVIGEPGMFNLAGFNIHSGVYGAREDVNCVMHTHTRAGVAVSATKKGLLPISQHAMIVIPEVSYFDYTGPGTQDTPEEIGKGCGNTNCVIMRNHGLLASGHSIQSAFFRLYYMETSCQIQTSAAAMGDLQMMDEDVEQQTRELYSRRQQDDDLGQREWPALMRLLERQGAEYRV